MKVIPKIRKYILIFNDIFDDGGMPSEYRSLIKYINKNIEAVVLTNQNKVLKKNICIQNYFTYKIFTLNKILRQNTSENDCVVIFSLFSFYSIYAALLCIIYKLKYVIVPFNQINDEVFKKKIFVSSPDIKALGLDNFFKNSLRRKIIIWLNPFFKKVLFYTLGKIVINNSTALGVFSNYEKNKFFKKIMYKKRIIEYTFGIEPDMIEPSFTNFYLEKFPYYKYRLNYIYWGRLDIYYKGIDLLIEAIKIIKEQNGDVPFRTYLMGPDYRNSIQKIDLLIDNYQLNSEIVRCGTDIYSSIDKIPLREADVSIYLSRWDGPPKTIRESILFDKPIIISEATHYGDFTKKYQNGCVLKEGDSCKQLAEYLLKMTDAEFRNLCSSNCSIAKKNLEWEKVANNFTSQLINFF